jgi:hypothetical protein
VVVRRCRGGDHRCAANGSATTREIILPIAWVWPILIWSAIGNREIRHNVQQLAFSSAAPLWRQLSMQWLAGFLVALIMASVAVLRILLDGVVLACWLCFRARSYFHPLPLHPAHGVEPVTL